jgi:hypothetical protein
MLLDPRFSFHLHVSAYERAHERAAVAAQKATSGPRAVREAAAGAR